MKLNAIGNAFKKLKEQMAELKQTNAYIPAYRIVEIEQDADDDYIITLQIINKSVTFKMKPEEILAKDDLVDQFSPRDIRTLTYLGYLGINSPKFKVLAKRLSENDDKLMFAIKQKGNKKVMVKTADEIIKEKEILESLDPKDAHLVGYTVASESASTEQRQKEEALKQLAENKKN